MEQSADTYPANLKIDYPVVVDKTTTLLRIFTVIPIAIVLGTVGGGFYQFTTAQGVGAAFGGGGILFIPTLIMILFREKYPRWWFDWNLNLTKFTLRVFSYLILLRHEYPSTDEDQAVHVELRYPEVKTELTRWMPLVKWFLAIPHYFVLFFLGIAVFILTVVAWFTILFKDEYPEGFFDFIVGVERWALRVQAYSFLLITDKYPPFSLTE